MGTNNVEETKVDASVKIAKRAYKTQFSDLPANVVEKTKYGILDLIGVMFAATTLGQRAPEMVAYEKSRGGIEEATVVGCGGKLPIEHAVTANGYLAHSLDLDDYNSIAGTHHTASNFPTAMAVFEKEGKGSGKDLITAVAIGNDLNLRLGYSVPQADGYGILGPMCMSVFSSAITAAKAMGLTEVQFIQTLAFATLFECGIGQCLHESGTQARELYQGFAQRQGLYAAITASKDITCSINSFEGVGGLYKVFFGQPGMFIPEYLDVDRDYDTWYGEYSCFKMWCSCGITQPAVTAAKIIKEKYHIDYRDIAKIRIGVGNHGWMLSHPEEAKQFPKNANDGKFSVQYALCNYLVKDDVSVLDFNEEARNDPRVLALTPLCEMIYVEEYAKVQSSVQPSWLEIIMKDGTTYKEQRNYPLGDYRDPFDMQEVVRKFRKNCSFCVNPVNEEKMERIIDICTNLESVENLDELISLLG